MNSSLNTKYRADYKQEAADDIKSRVKKSTSYRIINYMATLLDRWFLDPVLGLLPVVGDLLGSLFAIPFLYVSIFKVRSVALTLAVIYHILLDIAIGMFPFLIGAISDFFYHANMRNFKIIQGFVEGNKNIIAEVNRKATFMGIMTGVLFLLICLFARAAIDISFTIWEWVMGLFA